MTGMCRAERYSGRDTAHTKSQMVSHMEIMKTDEITSPLL